MVEGEVEGGGEGRKGGRHGGGSRVPYCGRKSRPGSAHSHCGRTALQAPRHHRMRIAMRPTDDDCPRYAHHRLEAFNLALDLLIEADQLCGQIKKPYRKIADQWLRAALGTFLLT